MSNVCLQGEVSECGLACLSFISPCYGKHITLKSLRKKFKPGDLGMSLAELAELSSNIGLKSSPISFIESSIEHLPTPCIVHLESSHYIVVEKVNAYCAVIMNPAVGRQIVDTKMLELSLSGYALVFEEKDKSQKQKKTKTKHDISIDPQLLVYGVVSTFLSIILPSLLLNINNGFSDINNLDTSIMVYFIFGQILSMLIMKRGEIRKLKIQTITMIEQNLKVMRSMLANTMYFFERRNANDISNKILKFTSAKALKSTIYNDLILNTLQAVVAILVIAYIHPALAVTMLIFASVSCIISTLSRNKSSELSIISESYSEKIFKFFVEAFNSISDIKSSSRNNSILNEQNKKLNSYANFKIKSGVDFLKYPISQQIITLIETVTTLWLCMFLVDDEYLPLSSVFLFFYIKTFFFSSFMNVISINNNFGEIDAAESRVIDIMDFEKSDESTKINNYDGVLHKKSFSLDIANNMRLKYPNISIEPGDTIAIVGPSGSGKTTLLKLISGYFDEFEMHGKNKQQLNNNDLISNCYYQKAEQDFFTGTVRDNLTLYDSNISDKYLYETLHYFELNEILKNLPNGLDTSISDYTNPFSSGEKQRILLCRAFISKKQILLLDEPTSNLDPKNAKQLIDKFTNSKKTIIFTTHNVDSIRGKVDKIIDLSA